jgi:hypothetical protein
MSTVSRLSFGITMKVSGSEKWPCASSQVARSMLPAECGRGSVWLRWLCPCSSVRARARLLEHDDLGQRKGDNWQHLKRPLTRRLRYRPNIFALFDQVAAAHRQRRRVPEDVRSIARKVQPGALQLRDQEYFRGVWSAGLRGLAPDAWIMHFGRPVMNRIKSC